MAFSYTVIPAISFCFHYIKDNIISILKTQSYLQKKMKKHKNKILIFFSISEKAQFFSPIGPRCLDFLILIFFLLRNISVDSVWANCLPKSERSSKNMHISRLCLAISLVITCKCK